MKKLQATTTLDAVPFLMISVAQVYPRSNFMEIVKASVVSTPALVTPLIIVGGILAGWSTAMESAAVAVHYAAILSIFYYRETGLKQLWTPGFCATQDYDGLAHDMRRDDRPAEPASRC